eukprot:TRINITY_DN11635_c0_g1_i1.p1 TRINITY_DN11635_c0_g1~~TRINITY_DN11635_c0_g1_i1.p1  ORF type:complete len:166 (+),score=16.83 TRINITY_DN11635_c0_g1_i1:44-541(+)
MIKYVLVINNEGVQRLVRFYEHMPDGMQHRICQETFQIISKRSARMCNFIQGGALMGKDSKIVYRQFATLYFIFCVDSSESELGILDLIQVFVETLDKCFENVCELDLVYNFEKVHQVLDEIVMGGMVLETRMSEIFTAIDAQTKIENVSSARPHTGVIHDFARS